MNTAVINIKTQPIIKEQAQKVASELGFSLSSLLNAYLKQLIKTKTVYFTADSEEPSEYLLQSFKRAEEQLKRGETSPKFETADDLIAFLHQENPLHER